MHNLVNRLRMDFDNENSSFELRQCAADEIERLNNICEYARNEIKDQRAEIERLRDELEKQKRLTKTALRMPFMRSTPKGWEFIPEEKDD